jgi:hypothetical protein
MSDTAVVETTPAATPAATVQAAFAQAKASQTTSTPEATPEVKTEAEAPVPQFFQKPKAEEKAAPSLDWNALPEDERKNGYLRQQDYTKKTQELAEQRRIHEAEFTARREEFERFAKMIAERQAPSQTADPNAPQDPMAKIQALRDEGNYAEADRELLKYAAEAAQAQVEPIKKEAETQRLQATFQNVTNESMAHPLVKHYAKEVAQVFDSQTPIMQEFRAFALSSPERMKTFIPAITYLLATEQHAKSLEANYEKRVEEGIKSGIEQRRNAAARVPGKVVESSGQSRETATGKMSLNEAWQFAAGQRAS